MSPYVAQAVKVIRESGLPQETNALFTNVEGDLDEVLKVAGEAAKKLAEQGYRTSLVLHMDIRPGFTVSSPRSRRSSTPSSPAKASDRRRITAALPVPATATR